MKFGSRKSRYTRRTARNAIIAATLVLMLAVMFGTSFAVAQGVFYLPWQTFGSGTAAMSGRNHQLFGLVGQSIIGSTDIDRRENSRTQNERTIIFGFQTGASAGARAFQGIAPTATRTPDVTSTSEPMDTVTPEPSPTVSPDETVEPVASPTETPAASGETATAVPTDTPIPPTQTSTPTMVTPTAAPTETPIPPTNTATATSTPVPPTATATLGPPTATATPLPPLIVVVTPEPDPPTPEPSATATPASGGGACGLPASNGPRPTDMSLLLILAVPLLWRFGLKR